MLCLDAWGSGMFGLGWYKFSCVALSCCTPSCLAIFLDIWLINPKNSLNPLFKAILYALSWVMKLVNRNLWTERQGTQNHHAQQKNKAHKTTTNNRRRKKHTKPPRTTEKQGTQNHHEQQENKAHKTTLNNRKTRHTKPPWTTERQGTQNHHEQQKKKKAHKTTMNNRKTKSDFNILSTWHGCLRMITETTLK